MKYRKLNILTLIVLLGLGLNTNAQEGPFVPCPDCESRINAPFPSSGAWANTDQTGSGFNLQIQNGYLVGFYYGYDTQGRPEWLLFNGPLSPELSDGLIQWKLEASLSRFAGGSYPGCDYQAPTSQVEAGTIKLEFLQRNYASFQFNDDTKQFMVPLLYGSAGFEHFAEQTPYLFPELGEDGLGAAPWVLVLNKDVIPLASPATFDTGTRQSIIVHFLASEMYVSEETGLVVRYITQEFHPLATPPVPLANIRCTDFSGGGNIECEFHIGLPDYSDTFRLPIGNLSANRFFAEQENGDSVEGFRIKYD